MSFYKRVGFSFYRVLDLGFIILCRFWFIIKENPSADSGGFISMFYICRYKMIQNDLTMFEVFPSSSPGVSGVVSAFGEISAGKWGRP